MEPLTIISVLSALGVGAIVQQLLVQRKTSAEAAKTRAEAQTLARTTAETATANLLDRYERANAEQNSRIDLLESHVWILTAWAQRAYNRLPAEDRQDIGPVPILRKVDQ